MSTGFHLWLRDDQIKFNCLLDLFRFLWQTQHFINQTIFNGTIGVKIEIPVGITLAMAGVLNPILAAAAMILSSLSVIGNSRRLK